MEQGVGRKQKQRCPAANALTPLLGTLQEPIQSLVWGPAKPQGDAATLTLAGAAHGVIAPKGLCPAGQACGATPVFHLAVGAAQLPADQGLDVLDCGRRREERSQAVARRCGCPSVAAPGDSGPRSPQGAGHGLLSPQHGTSVPTTPSLCMPELQVQRPGHASLCPQERLDRGAACGGGWGCAGPGEERGCVLGCRLSHRRLEAMGEWPLGAGQVTQNALEQALAR